MKSITALVAAVGALVTALVLSSCSTPASDGHTDHQHGTAASAAVNDADVAFATDMIPHHQQAAKLSALVPGRSTNPAVVKLAAHISAGQAPEIETMRAFLAQWNGGPQDADTGHQGPGGVPMQGMVDDATMTKLVALKGNDFDTLWLKSMIGHHDGAIGMATTELAYGANADVKKLADQIATVQNAEIAQMKQMVG